jgi:hypothetical protein
MRTRVHIIIRNDGDVYRVPVLTRLALRMWLR